LEDPVDFLPITRVVGARRAVDLARAAAKVRHGIGQPLLARPARKCARVMTMRGALKAVEQHEQGLRTRCILEVDVDEIAVRRVPALASIARRYVSHAASDKGRPDRLRVAAWQPERSAIVVHDT